MTRAAGAAAALLLLGMAAAAPPDWPVAAGVPRWLWLSAPWVLLLLRPRPTAPARAPLGVRWARRAQVALTNLLLATAALALALVAAEGALRFALRGVRSAGDARAYFHQYRQDELNSLGFREREFTLAKPPRTYRIAVLGDSLSWGVGVALAERFGRRIEDYLNAHRPPERAYEVLTFAQVGWDTDDEVQALRTLVIRASPDFVILQWYVNDFENGDRTERPRPSALVPWAALQLFLLRTSALYSLLEAKWVALQETLGMVETYPAYMYDRFGDPEGAPSVSAVASLREFVTECRQRQVPATIVLFPHAGPGLVAGRYEYDYLHDRVQESCRAEGIQCVDLRATFAPVADYRQLWASPLDPHPSALAHRLAAARLIDAFGAVWLASDPAAGRLTPTGKTP